MSDYVIHPAHTDVPCFVLQILREKKAAAELATSSAIAAARQLHTYVSDLNSQHYLMQRAAQAAVAQATAAAAQAAAAAAGGRGSRAPGLSSSRVGSHQHLELLAAVQQQHVKEESGSPFDADLQQQQQQQGSRKIEMSPGSEVAAATAAGDDLSARAAAAPDQQQQHGDTQIVLGHDSSPSPVDMDAQLGEISPAPAAVTAAAAATISQQQQQQADLSPKNAAMQHELDHDDPDQQASPDDLEAAALLGSLHDLAAAVTEAQ